jgi:hypothetical protein
VRSRIRTVWTPGEQLLSGAGLERALAGGIAILKVTNLAQMAVTVAIVLPASRRPWLEAVAAAVFAASGVGLIVTSARARRLVRGWVAVDAAVAVVVLAMAPLFQPPTGSGAPWTGRSR